MQRGFYEEFPNKENLQKLKLIDYQIRLFVASKSLEEFKKIEKQVLKIKKDTKIVYWPIIKNSYWISPFSNTKNLIQLFKDLNKIKNHLSKRTGKRFKNCKKTEFNKIIIFRLKGLDKKYLKVIKRFQK